MCLIASDGLFQAGSGLDQATHSLRMLTVDMWDSVARIADGFGPDDRDRAVLRGAAIVLRGQAEAIEFVEQDAAGTEPKNAVVGFDALVDAIWRAGSQIGRTDLLGHDPVRGLGVLAAALEGIADGDRERAKEYDQLIERLSRLVEQLAGDAEERVTI